jgi:hypothetical protein
MRILRVGRLVVGWPGKDRTLGKQRSGLCGKQVNEGLCLIRQRLSGLARERIVGEQAPSGFLP